MTIYAPTQEHIARAAAALCVGELVAFPTETVYGLGAHAFDATAVAKIFAVKGRPSNNPLIVHVASAEEIDKVVNVDSLSALQRDQLEKLAPFWPGPLTVVLPARSDLPRVVTAGLDTVAIRIPAHPIALSLIRACGVPLAAPSANPSGYVSPTTASHVEEQLGSKLAIILDGGPCSVGLESTIISLAHAPARLLRAGGTTLEEIERAIGSIDRSIAAPSASPLAPGMLSEHYAPTTPVILHGSLPLARYPSRVGLIAFNSAAHLSQEFQYASVMELSKSGDPNEVAVNLFAALRAMDKQNLDLIVVDTCAEIGLGLAIMDRVRRASAGSRKVGN